MDARNLEAAQRVPASRKLSEDDARAILQESDRLLVAKGKKVRRWELEGEVAPEAVAAMLGPTGNLRAPTLRVGKTVLVGFDQEMFEEVFG